jgi:hypothetical protein
MSFIVAALIVSAQTAAVEVQQPAVAPATTAPAAAAPQKPAKPKLICKREDADSGSHMSRRTCMTAEQWDGHEVGTSRSGMSISGEAYQQGGH